MICQLSKKKTNDLSRDLVFLSRNDAIPMPKTDSDNDVELCRCSFFFPLIHANKKIKTSNRVY